MINLKEKSIYLLKLAALPKGDMLVDTLKSVNAVRSPMKKMISSPAMSATPSPVHPITNIDSKLKVPTTSIVPNPVNAVNTLGAPQ